jgi:hypothetical protein
VDDSAVFRTMKKKETVDHCFAMLFKADSQCRLRGMRIISTGKIFVW